MPLSYDKSIKHARCDAVRALAGPSDDGRWWPSNGSPPGPLEGKKKCRDRATAQLQDIWVGVFPGCVADRYKIGRGDFSARRCCTGALCGACRVSRRLTFIAAVIVAVAVMLLAQSLIGSGAAR